MNKTVIKLLGTAALISFGYSASAQTVVNISDPVAGVLKNRFANNTGSTFTQTVNIPENIDISIAFDDLPVDPNQVLATSNSAVTQIQNSAVQINSIAANVAAVDASVNLDAEGENGQSASGNFSTGATSAANEASEAAGNFALSAIGSESSEGSVGGTDPQSALSSSAFDAQASGAFETASASASEASNNASGAFQTSVEASTFVIGDITTAAIGVTNTTEMGFLGEVGDTVASAANTSNTGASFDSFNAGGMGLNALATNAATINASVTASVAGGSARIGDIGTTAVGAINTGSFSGRSVTVNVD